MASKISSRNPPANSEYKRLEDLTFEELFDVACGHTYTPLDVDEGDITWRFSPPAPAPAAHTTSASPFDDAPGPGSGHLNALAIDELFNIEEYRSLSDEDDTDIDHSDSLNAYDKYAGINIGGMRSITEEDIPLPLPPMTTPDSPPRTLHQPGKFTISPNSKRTVYWGDLADLWPEPPSPSMGLAPACLHAGGPPGPFVFGEPKAKAPEIEKSRVLLGRKGKEKKRSEGEKEARAEKDAGMGGKVWPQTGPSSSRKRKRGDYEVSSAPAPRSRRPRGVMVSKRVMELRNENASA